MFVSAEQTVFGLTYRVQGSIPFGRSVRLSHLNLIMLLLLLLFAAYIIVLCSHLVFMQLNPY